MRFTPETLGSICVNELQYNVVKVLLRHVNADVAAALTKGICLLLQFEIGTFLQFVFVYGVELHGLLEKAVTTAMTRVQLPLATRQKYPPPPSTY